MSDDETQQMVAAFWEDDPQYEPTTRTEPPKPSRPHTSHRRQRSIGQTLRRRATGTLAVAAVALVSGWLALDQAGDPTVRLVPPSRSSASTTGPLPQPTVTVTVPGPRVTVRPAPRPAETRTVTAYPAPAPTVTKTVTATRTVTSTRTVTAEPQEDDSNAG